MSPYNCDEDGHGINHLNGNSQVGDCHNPISYFDDSCDTCGDGAVGSLIHGYARREDELFSFLLAAFYPWQSS